MEEAENLCDRVLILKAGRRLCEGSVAEIIESSPCENLEDAYLWYSREETNI